MVVCFQQRMENLTHRKTVCIVNCERRPFDNSATSEHKKTLLNAPPSRRGWNHCTNKDGMTPNPWKLYHSTHMSARLIIRADYLCLMSLMIFCCI